jgi:hypothetical protein
VALGISQIRVREPENGTDRSAVRLYRAADGSRVYILFGVLGIAFLATDVVSVAVNRPAHDAFWIPAVAGLTLLAAAFTLGLWRLYSACAIARDDAVVVRNVLRTHEFPWSTVSKFTWDSHFYHGAIGAVHLDDGRRIRIYGIRSLDSLVHPNPGPGTQEIGMLNAELHRARARAAHRQRRASQ